MRWSEIGDREMIDIYNGSRLGRLDQADMNVDPETGEIIELLISNTSGLLGGFKRGAEVSIPWSAVKRVGPQIVLVEWGDGRKRVDET